MPSLYTKVRVYNDSSDLVNPATEEKQDSIISALGGSSGFIINVKGHSTNSNIQYVGKAAPTTSISSASWEIRKIDTTTGSVILYADGNNNFDNVFANRESLNYS